MIESIAGKGLGIVATERISKGEKVFEETPLLRGKTQDLRQRLNVAEAVANLSNTKRKRFRALFNSFPEEEDLGIIRTNCYALGTDSVYCGVFRKLSRVNHSCTPNCERWWDSHRDAETLYALRDIDVGEELTVWYTSDVARMTRSERQEMLRRGWRFDCQCECCQLTGPAQTLSDKRRTKIKEIDDEVAFNVSRGMIILLKMALEYAEEEGLRGTAKTRICYDGFQVALGLKNLAEAKKFIKMCHDEYLLATGPTSEETQKMRRYMENPTSHVMWNS